VSYVCFNRIAVIGARPKLVEFRNNARRRLPRSVREPDDSPSVAFSLERLFRTNRLAAPSSDGVPYDWGPYHYFSFIEPLEDWHGYARVVYGLEVSNYEVYELLKPLSRAYPDLCFVDSQISLDSGEIMAAYLARGRCYKWILPDERCNAHWKRAAADHEVANIEDAYEDDDVRADAEGRMLAEAMAHWDKQVPAYAPPLGFAVAPSETQRIQTCLSASRIVCPDAAAKEAQSRSFRRNLSAPMSHRDPLVVKLQLSVEEGSRPRVDASHGERVRLVLVRQMAGVGQTGEDILVREARVISKNVGFRFSRGQQVEDELHRQPRAADHRLSSQNLGINYDAVGPRHR
jgi:hypothetical protein